MNSFGENSHKQIKRLDVPTNSFQLTEMRLPLFMILSCMHPHLLFSPSFQFIALSKTIVLKTKQNKKNNSQLTTKLFCLEVYSSLTLSLSLSRVWVVCLNQIMHGLKAQCCLKIPIHYQLVVVAADVVP